MDIGSLYLPAPKRADGSESEKLQETSRANGLIFLHSSSSEIDKCIDKSYSRNFDPKKQIRSLFRAHVTRMTLTSVLIGLIIVTLKIFADHGNINITGKRMFNLTITILSLILNLNFFVRACFNLRVRPPANLDGNVRKHSKT